MANNYQVVVAPSGREVVVAIRTSQDRPVWGKEVWYQPWANMLFRVVYPPSRLQKWLGITFDDKVQKVYDKYQTICDRLNQEENSSVDVAARFNVNLEK